MWSQPLERYSMNTYLSSEVKCFKKWNISMNTYLSSEVKCFKKWNICNMLHIHSCSFAPFPYIITSPFHVSTNRYRLSNEWSTQVAQWSCPMHDALVWALGYYDGHPSYSSVCILMEREQQQQHQQCLTVIYNLKQYTRSLANRPRVPWSPQPN
jgi:hypothetical protein